LFLEASYLVCYNLKLLVTQLNAFLDQQLLITSHSLTVIELIGLIFVSMVFAISISLGFLFYHSSIRLANMTSSADGIEHLAAIGEPF
jgi:hypothetical protein